VVGRIINSPNRSAWATSVAKNQASQTVQSTNKVSLEGLPQGVYLLRVTLEGGKVFSDKVVKE